MQQPNDSQMGENGSDRREGRARLWIWVVVGLVAIGVIVLAQVFLRQDGNSESAENYKAQAQRACQQAVRDEVDDAAAEFSDESVEVTGEDEPTYTYAVTGSVSGTDSQGNEVSSAFTCEATYSIGTAQTSAKATLTQ